VRFHCCPLNRHLQSAIEYIKDLVTLASFLAYREKYTSRKLLLCRQSILKTGNVLNFRKRRYTSFHLENTLLGRCSSNHLHDSDFP